jgi:hypothetical protein
MFSPKEKERDKRACMHMHVCMHVPTAAQPHLKVVRVFTTWASVCAATISLIHPLCLSVCLCMYVRVFAPWPYNRTPTQAHTSWYSRHFCHILESVGRHRRDTLRRKKQITALRGAGARAHERRTGVVAAEGAAAKGFCPRYGRARDGAFVMHRVMLVLAFVIHQWPLLGTYRRAQQLVLEQSENPAKRRQRELGRQLSCILRKANKTNIYIYIHTHTHTQFTSVQVCMCAIYVQQVFDVRSNICIHSYVHTHTHTFNTFTQAQYSLISDEKHAHSLK